MREHQQIRPPDIRVHDIGDDHYHDEDSYSQGHERHQDGLWQTDTVDLTSVGIDIGSSGTQVVFSRIRLQRLNDHLTSRYYVVAREQIYQSPVSLTPYEEGLLIDRSALSAIIDDAYRNAEILPETVDTGAVILTGEALRRENAQNIGTILAEHSGEFVCTMAGHHIEAMLAAYGSGAAWTSNQIKKRILNIDIGGGTTKFALIEDGKVLETAAIHVGGRLHVFDDKSALVRLEPGGQALATDAGMAWTLGTTVTAEEKDRLAERMAQDIIAAVASDAAAATVAGLFLTDPLPGLDRIEGVMFSGGVSEYVYGHEERDFHDMGKLLGATLARIAAEGDLPWPLLPAGSGIRATALGLSEYSVQLSGNTIFASDPDKVLPRRNLRVVQPDVEFPDIVEPDAIAQAITRYVAKYEPASGEPLAYAFRWRGTPTYARIRCFAEALGLAFGDQAKGPAPIYVVLDGDIARTLGRILRDELQVTAPLLIVDGVMLSDFDYIDFGKLRLPSNTVPVTIKSLLFQGPAHGAELH